jgi:hypothetical protein
MGGRIILAALLLASILAVALACAGRRIHDEAATVEAKLTRSAIGDIERLVKPGVSTSGRDIDIVTAVFLIDQPVFEFRDFVNDFLLGRGYAQSSNISTPSEFSIGYDGFEGLVHVEVMAEVAQPPSTFPTELPEPEDSRTMPPVGTEAGEDSSEGEPADSDIGYHRVTLQISY